MSITAALALAAITLASDLGGSGWNDFGYLMSIEDVCLNERTLYVRKDAVLVGPKSMTPNPDKAVELREQDGKVNLSVEDEHPSDYERIHLVAKLMSNHCEKDWAVRKIDTVFGVPFNEFIALTYE